MTSTVPRYVNCSESVDYVIDAIYAALKLSEQQSELYRPSSFWKQATNDIMEQVVDNGIENFRSLSTPLNFFVPTYGQPFNQLDDQTVRKLQSIVSGNQKTLASMEQYISGYNSALADFRVMLAADDPAKGPDIQKFTESNVGNPIEQFEFNGRMFSRSSLNYLSGLCFLKSHLENEKISTVVEIGGGFGSLGEILLKANDPDIKYIDFDIPPNSTITQYYLSNIFDESFVSPYSSYEWKGELKIKDLPAASALCNWQIEQLSGQVDLFVNFISFQEMEYEIVANYLSHIERLETRWILLRNLREGKQVKTSSSVGVEVPILGPQYAKLLPAYDLIDSNVLPFGYQTVDGYNSELLLFKRR